MSTIEMLHYLYLKLGILAVICLSLNVILCLYKYKELSPTLRRFGNFLLWGLLIELTARVFAYSGMNNLPLLHLYTLGEFILLGFFYKSLITKPISFRKNFVYLLFTGAILIIMNSLFFQSIYGFNNVAKTSVQLAIISFAVLYFYNLTENRAAPEKTEKGLRLINSAILIYYSGSLFVFMCSQVSFEKSGLYEFFWAFNAALNLCFQLLVLWGIWKIRFQNTALST